MVSSRRQCTFARAPTTRDKMPTSSPVILDVWFFLKGAAGKESGEIQAE
jgi:hypothetical protein